MKYSLIPFLLLYMSISFAQTLNIDSLKAVLKKQSDGERLETLLHLSKELSYTNYNESLNYGEKAEALAQELGNDGALVQAYSNIGDAYYYAYSFKLAQKYYIKSMTYAQSEDLQEGVANACNNLGIVHYLHREFDLAIQYYSKAEKIYEAIDDKEGLGNTQNNIGNIYLEQSKLNEATEYYEKALKLKQNNPKDYAKALNNIGNVFEEKGEFSKALDFYKKALETIESGNDSKGIADASVNIGVVNQNYGAYDKSMAYFRKALELYQEINDAGGVATCYNNIGLSHYQVGNYEEALSSYQSALGIQETIGDQAGVASSLHNIATIFDVLNQFKKALSYYEQALAIKTELNDTDGIANEFNSIGNTHANLDDYDKALQFYNQSLEIKLALEDKPGIAMLYQNVGALMEMSGNDSEAINYYEKSLEIEKVLSNTEGIAHSFQNIGTIYKNAGDFTNAKKYYLQAHNLAKEHGLRKILMNNNKYLSEVSMLMDEFQTALDYYIDYTAIKDTLFNEKSQRQISDIQTKYESEKKQQQIEIHKKDLKLKDSMLQKRRLWIYSLIFGIIIIFVVLFLVYSRYLLKTKANLLLADKNKRIETHQKEILDSIQYASKIQGALLPPPQLVEEILPHSFILNKPRDVVSGDFYWMTHHENRVFVAAADCTGHGVPGAFMSMLGITYLNEAVNISQKTNTGEILDDVRAQVIKSLHQKNDFNEIKDGMDIALYSINKSTLELEFSGAHNPLYIIRDGEIIELKSDNMPIAIYFKMENFSTKTFMLEEGDMLYTFSDGYIDQFGGPKGKKFLKSRFKKLLIEIATLEVEEQKRRLEDALQEWVGDQEQIDDILIVGLQIVKKNTL